MEIVRRDTDRIGGLDIAFNSARTLGEMGPTPDIAASSWHDTMDVSGYDRMP